MGRLIAIDPGINFTGSAKFRNGVLVNVLLIKRRAKDLALNICEQCEILNDFCWDAGHDMNAHVVVEMPRNYPKSPVRINDIVDLAAMAGALGESAANVFSGKLRFVYPKVWKGDVPKPIHNERILEKVPKLNGLLKPYPKGQHEHIIDAVGIGLWAMSFSTKE